MCQKVYNTLALVFDIWHNSQQSTLRQSFNNYGVSAKKIKIGCTIHKDSIANNFLTVSLKGEPKNIKLNLTVIVDNLVLTEIIQHTVEIRCPLFHFTMLKQCFATCF